MIFLEGIAAQTDYTVSLYLEGSNTATANSPYTLVESVPGVYSVTPTEPDGKYVLKYAKGATVFDGFARYEIKDGVEASVGALEQPDNTTIATLATRITDARALKLDTVSEFDPANDAVDIGSVGTIAVTSPADFGSGGGADTNAIASAVNTILDPTLDAILSQASLGRQAQTNRVDIDRTTAIVTVLADDNITPVFRFRTLDASGLPSLKDAVTREVLPLT